MESGNQENRRHSHSNIQARLAKFSRDRKQEADRQKDALCAAAERSKYARSWGEDARRAARIAYSKAIESGFGREEALHAGYEAGVVIHRASVSQDADRFYRGKCADFGGVWLEIGSVFDSSRLGVMFHRDGSGYLDARECRKAAAFLFDAADWLDARDVATDSPTGIVVYAISDGSLHHKIGKAINFSNRLKQLQTGNGRKLKLVAYLQCNTERIAYLAESAAKKSLSDCQAVGEWFRCDSHAAFQALHEAAAHLRIGYGPMDVCVGHDHQEATDGPDA